MRRTGTLLVLGLAVVSAAAQPGCGRADGPAEPPWANVQEGILADYDREIREAEPRSDGIRHVDTPATLARLREAHVTTYFYLVYHERTDWADLEREFLPGAARAGIAVWVYLVPPSECCSEPYRTDFVHWAREIARLSLRHPNLVGWIMDDFASNLTTFTPDYTRAMREAARQINPDLRFFPVLYHDDYGEEFLAAYAPYVDGAIFPYTVNFDRFDELDDELDRITNRLEPFDLDLVLMIYATKMSVAPYPPSAEYVAGALRIGLERMRRRDILGVTTYAMAKAFEQEACGFAHHLSLTVPSETATRAGDFVSASQTVRLDPDAARYTLRFFEQDSYPIGTAGYHFKQLLVDGERIWESDVASDAALSWVEQSFDLTARLEGKSEATITFRLYDKKGVTNFGIRVSIAALSATGFSVANPAFTEKTGWTLATQGPGSALYSSYVCDPDRQRRVFEAVRDLYRHAATARRGT